MRSQSSLGSYNSQSRITEKRKLHEVRTSSYKKFPLNICQALINIQLRKLPKASERKGKTILRLNQNHK